MQSESEKVTCDKTDNLSNTFILSSDDEIILDANPPIKLSLTLSQLRKKQWLR